MKFILGKKLNMTQIFKEDGTVIPVTMVLADPNIIAQIRTEEKDKYFAAQLGFGQTKKLKKPRAGHLKGLPLLKNLKEVRLTKEEAAELKRGDQITVATFAAGDPVKVTGTSKGLGFQGVVKRHGFHGSPATHGHKDQARMPGSIGATNPARVFKGVRMAGHMGNEQVTVSGLEVVQVDPEKNVLYIKGAVPGARNGLLLIQGPGKLLIKKESEPAPVATEEKIEEKISEPIKVEEKEEKSEPTPVTDLPTEEKLPGE